MGSEIDPQRGKVTGTAIRVGADPSAIRVGLGKVWVTDRASGTLWRIDPVTRAKVGFHLGGPLGQVSPDPHFHRVWLLVRPGP